MKKAGIVLADSMEFSPFKKFALQRGGKETVLCGYNAVRLLYGEGKNAIELIAVESGVGKVSAAAATSVLLHVEKVDMILSAGLSGAISGCRRGELIAGESACECDVDFTALGYRLGQKTDHPVFYPTGEKLLQAARRAGLRTGALGSGDIFLTDEKKKALYAREFHITCFDMESAAVGCCCYRQNVPYLSIRKVSDDASDTACTDYREMNEKEESSLTEVLFSVLEELFKEEKEGKQ